MSVKVICERGALLSEFVDLVAWADDLHLAFAWASSGGGEAAHWKALNLGKVRRAIIGVHFNQTEPHALEVLSELGVLRVVAESTGVFHPKVVLGIKGAQGRAIIGSSNFTAGGYRANIELNTVVEDALAAPTLKAVAEFMDKQWSGLGAFVPDDAWFKAYTKAWARRPKPPRTPEPPEVDGQQRELSEAVDLDLNFDAYFELVAAQEGRQLTNRDTIRVFDDDENGSYLQEAEACQAEFEAHGTLAQMPKDSRRLVGGWGDHTSGFFGHMKGAGNFKRTMLRNPSALGKHLDRIPLTGAVSRELAEEVIEGLVSVNGVAIGTASRLLTVKRPDLFLSVNDANRKRLREIFGSAPASVSAYLALHDQLWALPWAKADEPDGVAERRVWAARVALLDALLYEIP